MSHRSKILLWSQNPDRAARVEEMLEAQGIAMNPVRSGSKAIRPFDNEDANALVFDLDRKDVIAENEFRSLWAAAKDGDLKVIYLTDDRDNLPDFAPLKDDALQILAGPAPEQQLLSRIRLMTRLETMAQEIERRSETLSTFGIDTPYNTSDFVQSKAKVLVVGDPSADFMAIESAIASANTLLIGAYTRQMANEYLDGDRFDLILLNASDDRRSLLDFIGSTRLDSRFFNIPILVLGTNEQIGDPQEVYLKGATEISFKPLCEEALGGAAETLIREYRYHRHLTSIYYNTNKDSVLDRQTGLFCYGFLMDHLTTLVECSEQTDVSLTVAFFDILNLDAVNHQFGYAAGDSLIRQIGNMISRFFRGEDLCARYSGEEFVAVLPQTRASEADQAIRRLVSTVNTTQFQLGSGQPPSNFHLTFGHAEYELGDTAETVIARARRIAHRH